MICGGMETLHERCGEEVEGWLAELGLTMDDGDEGAGSEHR